MTGMLREIRAAVKDGYVAALPVPYHTCPEKPTFQSLSAKERPYLELEPHLCTRFEMADFAQQAREIGVNYLGTCCGGAPYYLRAMAEALGRITEASKYSPDIAKHFAYGNHPSFKSFKVEEL